ncbi:Opacity-associated protein A LysM-like domain-containing protein [Gallibacterium genomosp. 3]|uniref:Opacity-associated protein A LysM-like domain-containing protein n=1 Tax=Gallibacterium genomosp. 3 TaxID=505345 RepID=A0A1A7PQ08_9PAST|nr:LysM-like peptidoglycan-binding domain-containing protein [Gallibacterium genomosp. 3]OBX04643.1 Opacity-associated protein A LysM-like domain-containing protein [Gallibacterium genomosp. 3]
MSNIDKEQQPDQVDNKQSELNFDFDEFEPITPKKATKLPEAESSFLDKLKGLLPKKVAKQETAQPSFEPAQENNQAQYNEFDAEPVAVTKASAIKNLPTRYRRLAISLVVLLVIIGLFIWLKPNSQPVDNLQSQDNNLPIEFQPIDPNAAEANTPPQPNATPEGATAPTTETATTTNDAAATANTLTQDAAVNPTAQPAPVDNTPITTDAPTAANVAGSDSSSVTPAALAEKPAQPALSQEQINQIEKKAYQEEQARLIAQAKARAEQRAREEFRAKQQQESRKAQALLNGKEVPVVEAKPVPRTAPKATTSSTASTSSGQSKMLTVPAGTSLMQVFRDNKLNIADVNAMTKANGAGNALSSFKPGDKVAVKVNNDGRVSELQLPNGSKFIRQSNGTYIYKK